MDTELISPKSTHESRLTQAMWFALAVVPSGAAALLLLFAAHTARANGAWPSYSNPDPKSANSVLYIATGLGLLATLPSLGALTVGLLAARKGRLTRSDLSLLLLGAFGFVVLMLLFRGRLGDWYMD